MIGKGRAIAHGARAIDYALNKENAQVIDKRFVIGDNGKEIKEEFRLFQDMNTRTKNNDLSFVISPEPKDGKALGNGELKAISDSFLKGMGLDDHQSITVKHTDRAHTHLHIFVNRIDSHGRAYKDSFISKRSQTIADKVATEKGLTRASVVHEYNKAMTKDLRAQIHQKHKAVLQHRPKDFKSYIELMRSSGVKVVPTINRANRLQGFRVEYQGMSFKASEVHRSMTLSKMGAKTIGLVSGLDIVLKTSLSVAKEISKGISRSI